MILERGGTKDDDEDELEDGEEEDYEVGRGGSANTTLRKSAAYSLAQFSKTF